MGARPSSGRPALAAWDLDEIAQMYTDLVATYEPMRLRIESGELSSAHDIFVGVYDLLGPLAAVGVNRSSSAGHPSSPARSGSA